MSLETELIQKDIATGVWKPNLYLTNVSIAYLQNPETYTKAFKLFPMIPVSTSTGYYYKFDKATLTRDDVQRKPQFGKVSPVIMGSKKDIYDCKVDQVIIGTDLISGLNYERTNAFGINDPRKGKVIMATEKINIHLNVMFAQNFFQAGVWGQEVTGISTGTPSGSQFYQFNNANSDPIALFDNLKDEIAREGRRTPNKLALGVNTFKALKQNPMILERIKYSGSSTDPAVVNVNVLAELFGINEVVVLDSVYNTAPLGAPAKMEYICDANGALLLYAPNSPTVDEPSAGYTFSWDPTGEGKPIVFSQWLGERGTHSEFIEGLCSYDMKKVCDDMAIYLKDCVSKEEVKK